MTYKYRLSSDGMMDECPNWWKNFIFLEQVAGREAVLTALKRYKAKKEDEIIVFDSEEDFVFFKLKFDGDVPDEAVWRDRPIKHGSLFE